MATDVAQNPAQTETAPQTAEDYYQRAWRSHVKGDQNGAEQDFQQAVSTDSQSVEAYYGLGVTLKTEGRKEPALQAFEKALELINAGGLQEDRIRATMLRHLAEWHINMLKSGAGEGAKS